MARSILQNASQPVYSSGSISTTIFTVFSIFIGSLIKEHQSIYYKHLFLAILNKIRFQATPFIEESTKQISSIIKVKSIFLSLMDLFKIEKLYIHKFGLKVRRKSHCFSAILTTLTRFTVNMDQPFSTLFPSSAQNGRTTV